MNTTLEQTSSVLDILMRVIVIVVPLLLSWFARTFTLSRDQEKRLSMIMQVANSAIDYAEDVDKRGDLAKFTGMLGMSAGVATNMSKGLQKLNIAGDWLTDQLDKFGIPVTNEEAQKWIAAEYQKRIGSVAASRPALEVTKDVVGLIDELVDKGLVQLPNSLHQANELTVSLANWIVGRLGEPDKAKQELQRQEAASLLRDKIEEKARVTSDGTEQVVENRLRELTRTAVAYVEQLKTKHRLTMPERDIAMAWLLTEVTKQGLSVTPEQLSALVEGAYQ